MQGTSPSTTRNCLGTKSPITTFTAAGNKLLVDATEARMNCVGGLCVTLELAHQAAVLQVPQVHTLYTHARTSSNAATSLKRSYTIPIVSFCTQTCISTFNKAKRPTSLTVKDIIG